MAISFDTGISGVSRVNDALIDKDFPKSKAAFKPSGDNVTAHLWKELGMGRSFENRELKFATQIPGINYAPSPEEHHMMTDMALAILLRRAESDPAMKPAIAVLKESKELQEYLMMTRNILVAG